jgi:hypothetical protein
MGKIFIRERRNVGKGAGRPRFAVVAVEGIDLKITTPHLRKSELEALAAVVGAEVVYLPRGESRPGEGQGERGKSRKGWRRKE